MLLQRNLLLRVALDLKQNVRNDVPSRGRRPEVASFIDEHEI